MGEQLRRSQAQERRIERTVGGSRNAGSGNGWKRKADVRSHGRDGFLWEMKRTDNKKSISVKVADLDTVRKQAWAEGRVPLMHIEIDDKRYVILHEDDFMEMIEEEHDG